MKLAGTYSYDQNFADQLFHALCFSKSDKASVHEYHKVYAHVLDGRTVDNFLEIGLFLNELQTTDLTAWAAIYPRANIYGGDIKTNQLFGDGNIQMIYADQLNDESLTTLRNTFTVEFDVIIDDASHIYGPTINTFVNLFPALKSGGVYCIEDCQGNHPQNNAWQQTIGAISGFLSENKYDFEVFQSRAAEKIINPQTGEPTGSEAPQDDYIICVYKS